MRWALWTIFPVLLGAQDTRNDFEAKAWLGLSVDTFSAASRNEIVYRNPEESGAKRERLIGGVSFAYRLAHRRCSAGPQLWIFGQTIHGARSAELPTSIEAGRALVQLLRNASSLEANLGLRAELLELNTFGDTPARVYLKLQAGFLAVARTGADALEAHNIQAGILATGGSFAGSFIEAGYGRNDVFQTGRYRRLLIGGRLEWASPQWRARGMRPFVAITVDGDAGPGADSIQTSLGFAFDLDRVF